MQKYWDTMIMLNHLRNIGIGFRDMSITGQQDWSFLPSINRDANILIHQCRGPSHPVLTCTKSQYQMLPETV